MPTNPRRASSPKRPRYRVVKVDRDRWAVDKIQPPEFICLCFRFDTAKEICKLLNWTPVRSSLPTGKAK